MPMAQKQIEIREANPQDLPALMGLYAFLHEEAPPPPDAAADIWARISAEQDHHVILGFLGGTAVSSCVLLVVPNLTRGGRPYALVENVITHPDFRNMGFASAILAFAEQIARGANCYKLMLLSGAKDKATLRFYEAAGYNRLDKTAFIRWL